METYVKMAKKSYCTSISAAVMLRFVTAVLELSFLKVVTLSMAAYSFVQIHSCTTARFKLLVVVMKASNIIGAETSRYCFSFVIIGRD